MKKIRLSYFDFHGSRGEAARLAMYLGDIEFEDHRITFKEWAEVKTQMPFHAIPVLEVDGKTITQSATINRYVGKLGNLYPTDPWQATLCDETMDVVEEITSKVSMTIKIQNEEEKKLARKDLAKGALPLYLAKLQGYLQERGGEYFADNQLTVADLVVFVWTRGLRSGILEHIPADLVDQIAPLLVQHHERISNLPKILKYYENR